MPFDVLGKNTHKKCQIKKWKTVDSR